MIVGKEYLKKREIFISSCEDRWKKRIFMSYSDTARSQEEVFRCQCVVRIEISRVPSFFGSN